MKRMLILLAACLMLAAARAQLTERHLMLEGFHPDPTICRVGDDYYVCTSSFTWYPGLPIYHSRDLVHWQLVGHAIDRPGMVTLEGVRAKDGVWAPTLRWHDGRFYLFCNVSNRGNFYITATRAEGPWSDPVYIKDMPGIDPDIFWDDDGRSYVLGNVGQFPGRRYTGSTAIWLQEIDLSTGRLMGERTILSTGHALNARYSEGPHLYRVGKRYALLQAEGGTDYNHAVTLHWSDSLRGPYLPQQVNPVLTHRHLGHQAAIQCVGHADLVQTPQGEWRAVCLGKRMVGGMAFTRETFLCPVELQGGEFVFCPRPSHPSPLTPHPSWYYERIPRTAFDTRRGDTLALKLLPEVIDSLTSPALLLRKVSPVGFQSSAILSFKPARENEQAGLVIYRNNDAYIALLRSAGGLRVVVKEQGRKTVVCTDPYSRADVVLHIAVHGTEAALSYGPSVGDMHPLATVSMQPLAEDRQQNRFNGVGLGLYATSCGRPSKQQAVFRDVTCQPLADTSQTGL